MFIEIETLVRCEQYRDVQRKVQQERLIRQMGGWRKPAHPGAWLNGWIKRFARWVHPDRRLSWPIYRSEKTTAL
jgi:hypothetical protein